MPINRAIRWDQILGKPTTVAGLGLSDFNANAVNAQATAAAGAVGSYAMLSTVANTTYAEGTTLAGSGLRFNTSLRNSPTDGYALAAGASGGTPAGTWRLMARHNALGGASGTTAFHTYATSLWVRIA